MQETPTAVGAHYDRRIRRLVIDLSTGLSISFKPHRADGQKRKPMFKVDPIVKTKNRLVYVTAGHDNCEHKFLYNVSGGIS